MYKLSALFSLIFLQFFCQSIAEVPKSLVNKEVSLVSAFNNKCVDAAGGGSDQDTKIGFWECLPQDNQTLKITADSKNPHMVRLSFKHSGKCLTAKGSTNGSSLYQSDCVDNQEQLFFLSKKNKDFTIQTANGLCLDVEGWKRNVGASLQLWTCDNEQQNQLFLIYPAVTKTEKPFLLTFQTKDYTTDLEAHRTRNFIESLKFWKWDYEVIGVGVKWEGFGTKAQGILAKLKSLPDKERIVILSDADDVLVNGPPERFAENFLRISQSKGRNRIVFSSEAACCVEALNNVVPNDFYTLLGERKNRAVGKGPGLHNGKWMSAMKKIKQREGHNNNLGFDYLNAGMIAGRAKDLIEMLTFVNMDTNEDDQALFTQYFLYFPDRVTLDYQQVLFSNAFLWDAPVGETLQGCFFKFDEGKKQFINTQTESVPSLIQWPAKYWKCYDHMLPDFQKVWKND